MLRIPAGLAVILVLLLCDSGNASKVSVDKEYIFMKDWCSKQLPAQTIHHAEGWKVDSCTLNCMGTERINDFREAQDTAHEIPFNMSLSKPEGHRCEETLTTKNEPERACLGGICYEKSSIMECNNELSKTAGKHDVVEALSDKQCSIKCFGTASSKTIAKKDGSYCRCEDYFSHGTCQKGVCEPSYIIVDDPKKNKTYGGSASKEAAHAACKSHSPEGTYNDPIGQINDNDFCRFACFELPDTTRYYSTYAFSAGHSCTGPEANGVCDGKGKCIISPPVDGVQPELVVAPENGTSNSAAPPTA